MKHLLLKVFFLFAVILAYVASPFVTAWSIREAARNGDAAYLQQVIDWPNVRETLKPTLSRLALNLPLEEAATAPKPGLWQRLKAYWGQGAVDRAIDSYITPEGLPLLFSMRKTYRDYTGLEDEAKTLPITERVRRAWARVKRAEFTSFTTFEMDMADKHDENRIYLGKLELTGFAWKLKELRIKMLTTAGGGDGMDQPAVRQPLMTTPSPATKRWSTGFISPAEAAPNGTNPTGFFARAKAAARGELRGDR